ncbi:SPOR domain-containing protein [Thermosulfurimonas sp. F29]|uniref:SPOR domain-containing protein n=1 Tax=Thermosulfurimonas sp. F29 TaxID=2867247 RepID=UPI001C82B015|nr:SPOR domain-containing protein [Thermosulfurimonas sp. F29]MBX6424162.1 SPOR domain-containing protein [Thermosulfurimonas sp. F29]
MKGCIAERFLKIGVLAGVLGMLCACAAPMDPALQARLDRIAWRQAELERVCVKREDLRRMEGVVDRQGWLIRELDRNLFATQRVVSALEKRVDDLEDDLRRMKHSESSVNPKTAKRTADLLAEVELLRGMIRDLKSEVQVLREKTATERRTRKKPGPSPQETPPKASSASLKDDLVTQLAEQVSSYGAKESRASERKMLSAGKAKDGTSGKADDLYAVQLASFRRSLPALRFWAKLPDALRKKAFLYRADEYRTVRCGPFETRDEAERFLARVRAVGYEATVVPVDRRKYEERRWLQVGIFGKRHLATKWTEIWRLRGYEAKLIPLQTSSGDYWRVLVHVSNAEEAARIERMVPGAVPIVGI